MQIGFFDSGIGGITVLSEAIKILPREDFIYYADTLNVPYGSKPKDEVKGYVFQAIDFLVRQGVKAIVVACNTATSVAIGELRTKYSIPILGMEPAVKPAIKINKSTHKRILVTGTALTLKEEKLHNLISQLDNEHTVDLLPLPGLVEFAERFEFDEQTVLPYLKEQLTRLDLVDYETVVLGCTHFSYYKDLFRDAFPSPVAVIDGNIGTVNNLKRILTERDLLNGGKGRITFYHSGMKVEEQTKLERYGDLFRLLDKGDLHDEKPREREFL